VRPDDHPFVSVVVPTANRAPLLADCLETLVAQDYPADRYEVIVVHNGLPREVARPACGPRRTDPPAVHHLRIAGRPDANAARNAGLRVARGDPLCLVDDDVLIPTHWLRTVVEGAWRHPSAECLGGPVSPRFEGREPRTCECHELAGARLDEGPSDAVVDEVWSCNMAVRRAALDRVGPLREGLAVVHESEWEARLQKVGGTIVYLPEAWLWHRRLTSDVRPWSLVRDNFRLGYAVVALGQLLPVGYLCRRIAASLAHAAAHRCTRGLTDAVRSLGSLCAIAAGRRRRPWATSLR
jgi:GT2 family glycosyltransferase